VRTYITYVFVFVFFTLFLHRFTFPTPILNTFLIDRMSNYYYNTPVTPSIKPHSTKTQSSVRVTPRLAALLRRATSSPTCCSIRSSQSPHRTAAAFETSCFAHSPVASRTASRAPVRVVRVDRSRRHRRHQARIKARWVGCR
jgi:hypothetical protein